MADTLPHPPDAPEAVDAEKKRPSALRGLVEWVVILAGALLLAFVVKTFLLQAFFIPSGSMEPTLKIHDRVLVNKLSYDFHDVNRGDIVVFRTPNGQEGSDVKDLIKRVIALPGETIEAGDGRILIDGRPLEEPYLREPALGGLRLETQTVPPGSVFVMGDNRDGSKDSRSFGPIDEELIVGRAFVRVWPVTALSLL
ncbi:MAG TPA: signal peptidase I [Acidimicrobiales bacterium]|nr:signal peptidase I [Acidimicrobiales bacterium]